jgi:hypothetical protein
LHLGIFEHPEKNHFFALSSGKNYLGPLILYDYLTSFRGEIQGKTVPTPQDIGVTLYFYPTNSYSWDRGVKSDKGGVVAVRLENQ